MPRLALYALIVCVLSVAAAVVSFTRGSFLGIVWVLLAGLSSNMCWYYVKRARQQKSRHRLTRHGAAEQNSFEPCQKRYSS
jgi:ABC-type transport system involved in cytochrome c biogenesis permease subunit